MRAHAHRILAGALVVLLSAPVAFAQTKDPREEARGHLGPFYFTPTFVVEELGVDTNVFNDTSERSDFTFTLVPQINIAVPFGRRAQIAASTKADVVYYHRFGSERSINPDVKMRGELALNRITLFVTPAYANSRRRPSLEIDTRARHQVSEISGGADLQLSERFALQLGGGAASVAFDRDAVFADTLLRETLNRRTRTAWMSIDREVTPLTKAFVRVQVNAERFPFSAVRDADTISVTPGVEFKPLALISGSAAVGARRFRPLRTGLPEYTGVIAHANLAYTFQGSTRFRFTADRDLAYSYSETQPYYVINGYGLAINRHIGGRFDVTAGGDWQRYTYRSLAGLEPLPGTPLVNRTRTWSLSTGYRLARSRRIGFGATYRERDSNAALFQPYAGLRIMWTIDSGL